jgi:hypothetical protein
MVEEIYQLITEFNYLMQVVKIAHSSELSEPYRKAQLFYNPLFSNFMIGFAAFDEREIETLTAHFTYLQGCFRSGMINKAMQAYNILSLILKKLFKFSDSQLELSTPN